VPSPDGVVSLRRFQMYRAAARSKARRSLSVLKIDQQLQAVNGLLKILPSVFRPVSRYVRDGIPSKMAYAVFRGVLARLYGHLPVMTASYLII
jgi:hypothetical protein